MKKEITIDAFGKKVYLLGILKGEKEKLWLEEPEWDCEWYWGLGYIETYQQNWHPSKARDTSSHRHWDSTMRLVNPRDNFSEATFTDDEGWILGELFKRAYTLRKMTDMIYQKGAYVTEYDPLGLEELDPWRDKINTVLLPSIFKEIGRILTP